MEDNILRVMIKLVELRIDLTQVLELRPAVAVDQFQFYWKMPKKFKDKLSKKLFRP